MKDEDRTKGQLVSELMGLRQRVIELEKSETERKQAEDTIGNSNVNKDMGERMNSLAKTIANEAT